MFYGNLFTSRLNRCLILLMIETGNRIFTCPFHDYDDDSDSSARALGFNSGHCNCLCFPGAELFRF